MSIAFFIPRVVDLMEDEGQLATSGTLELWPGTCEERVKGTCEERRRKERRGEEKEEEGVEGGREREREIERERD